MEALLLGNPAILDTASKWETYTSFIQLRLKDHEEADEGKIAEYAKKKVLGVSLRAADGDPREGTGRYQRNSSAPIWYGTHMSTSGMTWIRTVPGW